MGQEQRPGILLLWTSSLALPFPGSSLAFLHQLPFLCFTSLYTSHHALLWLLTPEFTSPAGPQPLPYSSLPCLWEGRSPGPQTGGVLGKELLGLCPTPSLHKRLRPQPPPQGSHLARVLSFPDCKLPPAAPWHLLRFLLHERFSLGGFREGWRPSPSFFCLKP